MPENTTIASDPVVSTDVEMTPVETAVSEAVDSLSSLKADVKKCTEMIERGVASNEPRWLFRALRSLPAIRKRLDAAGLRAVLEDHYPANDTIMMYLVSIVDKVSGETKKAVAKAPNWAKDRNGIIHEVDMYLSLLVLIFAIDKKAYEKAMVMSEAMVAGVRQLNRRSLDPVAGKVFYYYGRAFDLGGKLADIRSTLMAAQRTAALHNDVESQATLINLLLYNYFHCKLYDQADKLVSKVTFPETAGNNQLARYMFYTGRLHALQLDYSAAYADFQQAIRKAPQSGPAVTGFTHQAQVFFIVVQLLMGEIPERSLFRTAGGGNKLSLAPYMYLTQAVRIGDVEKFEATLKKHTARFQRDGTYTLIQRLRHNVIKSGLRRISLAYSRISLKDICLMLRLPSEQDAEYIVAKAVRDGVIDVVVDHAKGWVTSRDIADIYATTQEPEKAFQQRTMFCLALHDDAVRAMRYPGKMKLGGEDEEAMKKWLELEREAVTELEEGVLDSDSDFDDMGDF